MPRDLPGLYWDEEKSRYFPLSMKPKPPVGYVDPRPHPKLEHSRRSASASDEPSRKRRRVDGGIPTFSALEKLRTSYGSATHRQRALRDIYASSLSLTCGGTAYPVVDNGHITSFCAVDKADITSTGCPVMVGDNRGWLYTLSQNDDASDAVGRQLELNIGSSVSAICAWGTRRVSVSFGWPCKVFVRDIQPVERWTILSMPDVVCYDVTSADLQGCTLALGGGERGVLVPDIEIGNALQVLPTGSSVLSIKLDQHLAYAGLRNGSITRFDTRLSVKNSETLLSHRVERSPSSITHLDVIHQNELLVSNVRGDLETYDLRFIRESQPLLQFSGHVNSSTIKLGIAVDPTEDFVFAAGQDRRVRGWSLHTGERLPADPINTRAVASLWHEAPPEQTRLFDVLFDEPVTAMQVTMDEAGPCMWASCGGNLYRTLLGSVDVAV